MGKVSISYCVNVMSLATVTITNGYSALLNFDKSKIIYSV